MSEMKTDELTKKRIETIEWALSTIQNDIDEINCGITLDCGTSFDGVDAPLRVDMGALKRCESRKENYEVKLAELRKSLPSSPKKKISKSFKMSTVAMIQE